MVTFLRRVLGRWGLPLVALVAVWGVAGSRSLWATTLVLKDGRELRGQVAPINGLKDDPKEVKSPGGSIIICDDGLRRIYVPLRLIAETRETDGSERQERFLVPQAVPDAGSRILSLGPVLRVKPWDDFGRRIMTIGANGNQVDVIQGITVITPKWTSIQSLKRYLWEMRIATSSIPRETLSNVLHKVTDSKDIQTRLKIVRLYLQAERPGDAKAELEALLKDFPEEEAQLRAARQSLTQLSAQKLQKEIALYTSTGRHQMAYAMLESFPSEGVAGEILQEVRERLNEYQATQEKAKQLLATLEKDHAAIDDSKLRDQTLPVLEEIRGELNIHNLDRFAAYEQLREDDTLSPAEKVSLAASGWLLGSSGAHRNLATSASTFDVRNDVRRYLNEPIKAERQLILKALEAKEGADPETMSRLVAHLKPPMEMEASETPGFYKLSITTSEESIPVDYLVQLPPEYDPYRRYPAILTLHAAGTTPEAQMEWWAGARGEDGQPRGHAGRYGYIVIAPAWAEPHQRSYEFSGREHSVVLGVLRDACRRFAIDTDRVFLTGHSMGGTAAWDIGLAHPDLWAGVIPLVAISDKFIHRYWQNGRNLPFYFVDGEMDGDAMSHNAIILDRWMKYAGFNLTIVEYLGRGHEHFVDEILHLFDWMGRYRRDVSPKKFECVTLRPWDNFFWWVEAEHLPEKSMVDPENWPPPRGTQEVKVVGTITDNNGLSLSTGAGQVTIWLSPDLLDLKRKTRVTVNGNPVPGGNAIQPQTAILLEDVRTRGDRQHPFWAQLEMRNKGK